MNFDQYVRVLKRKINIDKNKIVFVCIGTSNVLCDSIGPLVGSYLKNTIGNKYVIGDMNKNICSKKDIIFYYPKLKNKFIVAIDTAISTQNLEGEIFIKNEPIVMGKALNKNKGIIGNTGIKVAISSFKISDEDYIYKLADFVGKGIVTAIKY